MTELTLFDLNGSKELVEELSLKESKSVLGGQQTGGSSDDDQNSDCYKEAEESYCDSMEELDKTLERREIDRAYSDKGR